MLLKLRAPPSAAAGYAALLAACEPLPADSSALAAPAPHPALTLPACTPLPLDVAPRRMLPRGATAAAHTASGLTLSAPAALAAVLQRVLAASATAEEAAGASAVDRLDALARAPCTEPTPLMVEPMPHGPCFEAAPAPALPTLLATAAPAALCSWRACALHAPPALDESPQARALLLLRVRAGDVLLRPAQLQRHEWPPGSCTSEPSLAPHAARLLDPLLRDEGAARMRVDAGAAPCDELEPPLGVERLGAAPAPDPGPWAALLHQGLPVTPLAGGAAPPRSRHAMRSGALATAALSLHAVFEAAVCGEEGGDDGATLPQPPLRHLLTPAQAASAHLQSLQCAALRPHAAAAAPSAAALTACDPGVAGTGRGHNELQPAGAAECDAPAATVSIGIAKRQRRGTAHPTPEQLPATVPPATHATSAWWQLQLAPLLLVGTDADAAAAAAPTHHAHAPAAESPPSFASLSSAGHRWSPLASIGLLPVAGEGSAAAASPSCASGALSPAPLEEPELLGAGGGASCTASAALRGLLPRSSALPALAMPLLALDSGSRRHPHSPWVPSHCRASYGASDGGSHSSVPAELPLELAVSILGLPYECLAASWPPGATSTAQLAPQLSSVAAPLHRIPLVLPLRVASMQPLHPPLLPLPLGPPPLGTQRASRVGPATGLSAADTDVGASSRQHPPRRRSSSSSSAYSVVTTAARLLNEAVHSEVAVALGQAFGGEPAPVGGAATTPSVAVHEAADAAAAALPPPHPQRQQQQQQQPMSPLPTGPPVASGRGTKRSRVDARDGEESVPPGRHEGVPEAASAALVPALQSGSWEGVAWELRGALTDLPALAAAMWGPTHGLTVSPLAPLPSPALLAPLVGAATAAKRAAAASAAAAAEGQQQQQEGHAVAAEEAEERLRGACRLLAGASLLHTLSWLQSKDSDAARRDYVGRLLLRADYARVMAQGGLAHALPALDAALGAAHAA